MQKLSKILIVILIFILTIGFSNNIVLAEEDPMAVFKTPLEQNQSDAKTENNAEEDPMAVFKAPLEQYQDKAKKGDANLVKTIIETMIYATEWKDIPAGTRLQYIKFLNNLAQNSILSSSENETWLAAIKSRLQTIRQSILTQEQEDVATDLLRTIDETQEKVNKIYAEQNGTTSDSDTKIYKNPDKDEEEELNREIDTSSDAIDEAVEGADNFIDDGSNNQINEEELQNTFSYIYNIFLEIGIGISVIVAIILAIKFMSAGIDEKAEVKKMFFVYVIACIIIFGGFGIWKLAVNIIGDASTTSEVDQINDDEQNQDSGALEESGLESKDDDQKEENPTAALIRLNYTNLKINMNRVKLLKLDAVAVAKKVELAAEKILWKSSNEKVATVDSRGLVTFKEGGNVKITATLESNPAITKTCNIQVVKIVMKSIEITPPNYDKAVLMLDKTHYNFTILDTKVEPTNAKVKYTSSNEKVATVNKKGKIVAKSYGTATITATGTINGTSKSAKCEVRVITTMKDQATKDCGKFLNYKVKSATPEVCYIRNYNPSKHKIDPDKSGSWSKEEVESYINNGEWILKNYGEVRESKYKEAKADDYYYFLDGTAKCASKKQGDISPSNYLFLFTSRNQWVYLLEKKDEKWQYLVSMQASGGYYWGPKFETYIGSWYTNFGGDCYPIYYNPTEGQTKLRIFSKRRNVMV